MSFISKVMWFIAPLVGWIDKTFTLKSSIKIVDGDHYYFYRKRIKKGDVFLTSANGHGSNLINPSDVNHGAIYYGKGLKTAITIAINKLILEHKANGSNPDSPQSKAVARLHKILIDYNISDEVCYVIEAVGEGTIPTNLVKFMTSKDRMISFNPLFANDKQRSDAADLTILDLGKPYDYGFSEDEENRYCFEVPATAYESVVPNLLLKRHDFKILWKVAHRSFLADTFMEDTDNWEVIFDIKEKFNSKYL